MRVGVLADQLLDTSVERWVGMSVDGLVGR